jgi:hypothetical protein
MSGVSAYAGGTGLYVPLIDETASGADGVDLSISKSIVYVSDFTVTTRVRKKGILPFEISGTVTNSGYNTSAIRTTDSIVTA